MFGLKHLPVIDCHVHLKPRLDALLNGAEILEATKYRAMNIVCTPELNNNTLPNNPMGFLFKALHPGKVYVFPGICYPPAGITADLPTDFGEQVDRFVALGADGIKLHEGKPTVRREIGVPFDAPAYEGLFAALERHRLPAVLHVGDPWIFWNAQTAPAYAHKNGWTYLDGSAMTNDELYAEVDRVLERHPSLKLIFAHFYFMSSDLERATQMMERWPEICFDLTPGIEMFPNFSRDWERWREFFVNYSDRILFGTDIIAAERAPNSGNVAESVYRAYCVRNFLETDHEFRTWEALAHGFGLPEEILRKIYGDNFARLAGEKPRDLDLQGVLDECILAANRATGADAETRSTLMMIVEQLRAMIGR